MNEPSTGDAAAVLVSHVATGTVPEASRRAAARLALGNDIACRLALAVDMRLGGADRKPRVMSLTYQTGVLAGSLVAGRVAGLDPDRLLDCLGVAYSQVAGNLQGLFEGTLTVRLQQGIAAQSAVMALEFARAGITGAHDALEGRAGWRSPSSACRSWSRPRCCAGACRRPSSMPSGAPTRRSRRCCVR